MLSLLAALLVCLSSATALARAGGIAAEGCSGCHGGTGELSLSISTTPETFGPSSDVEVLLTISGSQIEGAGAFITTKGVGTLQPISGQGLSSVSNGLAHSQPKGASEGQVQFRFTWQSPDQPGAVRFFVYALGTNGNGQRSGDTPKNGMFDSVFGCEGATYYSDEDEDGFGRDAFAQLACSGSPPSGFVAAGGDCIDYDAAIHPTAVELCNLKDDDCNGLTDENALPVELWPDADGDGYYGEMEGEPVEGCVGLSGYAALGGDCDPLDPAIHPEAEETCNYFDENCDGEVDERSHAVCGIGWCARESPTCNADECRPGTPTPETCNLLDDDCDGQVDELDDVALCPAGEDCATGSCVPIGSVMPEAGGSSGMQPSTGSGGSSSPRRTSTDGGCSLSAAAAGPSGWLLLLLALASTARCRGKRRRAA
jgi:hypothetical protein